MQKESIDKTFKRHFIAYDTDLVHVYMESARIFKAKIYIHDGSHYRFLEDTHIHEVNAENNYFHFNIALDLSSSKKLHFRLLLESSALDFVTTAHVSQKDKGIQLLSLPKQITVHYERKSLRVCPSLKFAVEAALLKGQGFITCNVLDLSTQDMAVKVPSAAPIFKIGERIGTIKISLPGQVRVRVQGEIRSVRGERCGIKFFQVDQETQKRLCDYINYRLLVKKISAKTYKNIENELIKFIN